MSAFKVKHLSALVRVTVPSDPADESSKPTLVQNGFTADGKVNLIPLTKLVLLHQGDDLPKRIADGELDRLKRIDAVGTAEEVAAFGRRRLEGSAPDGTAADESTPAETPSLDDLASLSDEQLAALYASKKPPTVKALVEKVGDDAALAQRVLDAEKTALKGDARPSLVSALEKVTAAPAATDAEATAEAEGAQA